MISFEHLGPNSIDDAAEGLVTRLYVATHVGRTDKPFHSVERFVERIRGYAKAPGFELVIGSSASEPVGLALGYALPTGARWWDGLTTPVDPALIKEDGSRTFALCEIMTHPEWQGQGVAHQVHDELLFKRSERRATLLVDPKNVTANQAYRRWGWEQMGKLHPFADAPHYDALILDLSSQRSDRDKGQ